MIRGVRLIDLPKIEDYRGNLSFFENNNQIPFNICSTYWIYEVPKGKCSIGYASKKAHEFILAISGSFDIITSDGKKEKKYTMNSSCQGLYLPNLIWRQVKNFSSNSLALIVSNIDYNKKDFIRCFDEFQIIKQNVKK